MIGDKYLNQKTRQRTDSTIHKTKLLVKAYGDDRQNYPTIMALMPIHSIRNLE